MGDDQYTVTYSDNAKEVGKRIRNASAKLQAPEEVPEVQKPENEEPEAVKAIPEPEEDAKPTGTPDDAESEPPTPSKKTDADLAKSPDEYLREGDEESEIVTPDFPDHGSPYDPYDPQGVKEKELDKKEAASGMDCPPNREGFLSSVFDHSPIAKVLDKVGAPKRLTQSDRIKASHIRLGGGMNVRTFEYGGYKVKIFEDPADRQANIYYTFEVVDLIKRSDIYPSMFAAVEEAKLYIQRKNLGR